MTPFKRLAVWLDVRPNEVRIVSLSFLGAFLVMAFLVTARSLREALYLDFFDVKTLPYITAAVALLSVPTVGLFVRVLARYHPKRVLMVVAVIQAAGLAALWPFVTDSDGAVVAFYLWTTLGTLLLTSGFWVVTSELFAVRGAKRLFGLIGAGGTAGAMVMGSALVWLTRQVEVGWLVPGLVLLIALFLLIEELLPTVKEAVEVGARMEGKASIGESFRLVRESPHMKTIATIVLVVGIATTLLDYQFKDLAQANIATKEGLTSFFGAFYGWTGGVSLLIQLLLVARFLASAGVAWTLAVLPLVLMLGSAGLLVVPGLVLVTVLRGADASLRKSLYRSALEVLFVPVPAQLRRKTKTFIDSMVDSLAEGMGAATIFLLVTLYGLPSRYLSALIIALSIALLYLSRRMGRRYFETVTEGLKDSGEMAEARAAARRVESRDLLSGTFTRLDIKSLLEESGETVEAPAELDAERPPAAAAKSADTVMARLESSDLRTVARTLEETVDWQEEHVPVLCRLLARDALFDHARLALLTAGDTALPELIRLARDEGAEFVIRRRVPRVLARSGGSEADDALLDALSANRFEIRYRAAIALHRRRRRGLPRSGRDEEGSVWDAIRAEVNRGRPVWEMQRLLDDEDESEDGLVVKRLGARGELSLEHTFRLLSLVLEPEVVRAAFHGVILDDERLKSFSLEYLEQVLPSDIRAKLWPFIGDVSEHKREKSLRNLDDVVSDLMQTGETLFGGAEEREALKRILDERED